jgi:hypothetical protein
MVSATVRQLEVLHGGKERLGLHLNRLRDKLSRTRAQDTGQRSINLIGLTKDVQHCYSHSWRIALPLLLRLVQSGASPCRYRPDDDRSGALPSSRHNPRRSPEHSRWCLQQKSERFVRMEPEPSARPFATWTNPPPKC